VCVEHCPSRNEVGVRRNPVCVDDVDTSIFDDVDNNIALQAVRQIYYNDICGCHNASLL